MSVTAAPRLLYTVPDAAAQLSVSERKMRELIKDDNGVDSVLVGRRRLVTHEALVEYIDRLKRAS